MTDGELRKLIWTVVDNRVRTHAQADQLTDELLVAIKQNSPQGGVSPANPADTHDSSIPDDAGELRQQLMNTLFINQASKIGDVADDLLHLIHQQRQRWESAAQLEILRGFRKRDFVRADFYEAAVPKRLAEIQASLAAGERKGEV